MSHHRSYSFDSDNGHDSSSQSNSHPLPQPNYHDSPQRPSIRSPPPQYSAPLQQAPLSPESIYRPRSTHSRHSSQHASSSFEVPRRSFVIGNSNATPPVPPPHGTSPTREAYRPDMIAMDSYGSPHQQGRDHTAYNTSDRNQRGYFLAGQESPTANNRHSIPRRPLSRPYADNHSSASGIALAAAAATPGAVTPNEYSPDASSSRHSGRSRPHSYYGVGPGEMYDDSPYQRPGHYSHHPVDDAILPHNIVDDGDDGFMPEPKRKSMLPISRERSREALGRGAVGAGAGAATTAGTVGGLAGLFGRKEKAVTSSGSYDPVSRADLPDADKSEWLSRQNKGNNKMRWIIGIAIGAVVVLALIGGIVGGVLGSRKSSSGGSSGGSSGNINNAADDTAANGDLNLNSAEIKGLMNNKNLHKVFPGMDYTPWGVQYPLCLTYPPSQNNVTRDMAVLSQLTNAVRLYGTDCNQTQMVLHAIDRLELKDMKVWLGVWIDPNMTTTDRQLEQMYKILDDTKDHSIFKGVIIGNEALFRAGEDKASSHAELVNYLTEAKSNFTSLGYDLTVSTSDLGDNWDGSLADASHFVMSNVHPFFAGVDVENAASWTWDFWQNHDVVLTGTEDNQIIAETGWPSGGGTDCGNEQNVCADGQTGSVASVDNMNIFMEDWVCQALENGTNYFWFSAFDEAWKVAYNEPGKEWEDKWGLMDTARNLKSGLKIPDCGGKTVS